jgi:leucyl-tRNA synthetase
MVVELDGAIHETTIEQDEERTRLLIASGYRVIRFRNDDVFSRPKEVVDRIVEVAKGSSRVQG